MDEKESRREETRVFPCSTTPLVVYEFTCFLTKSCHLPHHQFCKDGGDINGSSFFHQVCKVLSVI